jgi:hypothetical protein
MSWVALAIGPRSTQPLQGKIVHGGNLHGNQEEGKKEETLVVSETILRKPRIFNQASWKKHLLRGFAFWPAVFEEILGLNGSAVSQLRS